MDMQSAKCKWKTHVCNSRKKGVHPLDFDEYVKKIRDAGISPDQIGNSRNSYQLGRFTDRGDYTPDSCRFITTLQNLAEQKINGGTSRMAEKKRGRTKQNDPSVAARSEKLTGRTKDSHPGIAIVSAKRSAALTGRTKLTHSGYASAAIKNSRPFAFISPDGTLHQGVNLEEFSRRFGLLSNAMNKLKNGRLKSYHGWRLP